MIRCLLVVGDRLVAIESLTDIVVPRCLLLCCALVGVLQSPEGAIGGGA